MTTISTHYQGSSIPLINDDPRVRDIWKWDPLILNDAEVSSLQLSRGIAILQQQDNSPAQLAYIKTSKIACPLIHSFVHDYDTALARYKELLMQASDEDRRIFCANCSKYHIVKNPPPPLVAKWLLNIKIRPFMSREQFHREARAQRFAWFVKVATLEDARLQKIRNQIENFFPRLMEGLREAKAKPELNEQDKELQMQAWQLKRIFCALFPNTHFTHATDLQHLLPSDNDMWWRYDTR